MVSFVEKQHSIMHAHLSVSSHAIIIKARSNGGKVWGIINKTQGRANQQIHLHFWDSSTGQVKSLNRGEEDCTSCVSDIQLWARLINKFINPRAPA
jgi:hypothetical protein